MFRIKVCGVTHPGDAVMASSAGADAVGLNFYAQSPRCVSTDTARTIAAALDQRTLVVGVFVNTGSEEIVRISEQVPLGAVQLHGDEAPDYLAELPSTLRVIKAVRIGASGLAPLIEFMEGCANQGRRPDAVLLDAASALGYGGTGQKIDWTLGAGVREVLGSTPWVLAGGLNGENVERAIDLARPDGVDTASGVESAPGEKDAELTLKYVVAASRGLRSLEE